MIKNTHFDFNLSAERRNFLLALALFIIITTVFFGVYQFTKKAQAGWWNDTWQYRKSTTIGSGSAGTSNYQILVNDYNTAADITAAKMQTDCGDIRFTSQAGVELPYWIQDGTCNSTTTDIWVKVDNIPATGGTTIYMYYGNPSATNQSRGNDTFEWFYDFAGTTIDTSLLNYGGGTFSQNEYLSIVNGADAWDIYLFTNATFNRNLIFQARFKADSGARAMIGWHDSGTGNTYTDLVYAQYFNNGTFTIYEDGNLRGSVGSYTVGTWYDAKVELLGSGANYYYKALTDSSWTTLYNSTYSQEDSLRPAVIHYDVTESSHTDSWFARKYLATEPTVTVNSEEQGVSPIAYYSFDEGSGTTAHNQMEKNSQSGLIGWWKFDDAASGTTPAPQDSMDVNDGTWAGNAAYTSTAKIGSAATFDGTGDYIEAPIPWTIGSEIQASGITYSAWIKTSTTATAGSIAGIGKDGGCAHYCLTGLQINLQGAGIVSMVMYDGSSYQYANSSASVADNAWHHITGVYRTNGYLELYVDSVLNSRVNAGNLLDRYTYGKIAIGANIDENPDAEFFTGQIDDVRVYNRALDSGIVSALYYTTQGHLINMDPTSDWVDGASQNPQQRPLGKALDFDGSNDYIAVGSTLDDVKTLSLWIKPTTNTQNILDLDGGTHYLTISSGTVSAAGFGSPTIYVNNTVNGIVTAGIWNHILVVTNTSFDASAITIGKITSNFFTGQIDEIKIYKQTLSVDQIKVEYNRGAGVVMGAGTHAGAGAAPFAYWKMDEGGGYSAFDFSGNNYTATMSATMTSSDWINGKVGKAVDFDGTDDTLFVDYESDFDFERTQALSMTAWVKTSATGAKAIFSKLSNSDNYEGYEFNLTTDGYLRFMEINQTSTNRLEVQGTTYVQDGAWHHVAVTYDGSSNASGIKLYVNGVLESTTTNHDTLSASILNNFLPYVGSRNKIGSWFNGAIDHLKIYKYVRTPEQIHFDMATGSPIAYYSFDEGGGTTANNSQEKINQKDLVGWWKLDEGADDLCTGGANDICDEMKVNDGTNSSATWATGRPGGALTTNGSSTYFQIPDHDSIDFAYNQDFAVSFWVKDGGSNANADAIVEKWAASGSYPYVFRYDTSNSIKFYRYDGTNNPGSIGTTTINDSAWHHIVGVKNGSTLYLYIDGVLNDSDADTTTGTTTNSSPVYVGMRGGGTNYYAGTVDDIQIYNNALTASEVSALYTSTKGALVNMDPNSDWVDGASQNPQQRRLGKALDFDGTNDRVHIPYTSKLNLSGRSPFTISVWINPDADLSRAILTQTDGTDNTFALARWSSGVIEFGRNFANLSSVVAPNNQWTHIIGVYDGDYLYLYINGKIDGDPQADNSSAPLSQDVLIGAYDYDTPSLFFDGLIDEVKIYNYALTADEVKTEYNRGAALVLGAGKSESDPATSLVGWWKLDEGGSYTAFDSSGKNNTGILTSGPSWAQGKIGKALSFDGSDDYVQIQDNSSLDTDEGAFTFSFWINPNTSASQQMLLAKRSASTTKEFHILLGPTGYISFDRYLPSGGGVNSTTGIVKFNTWNYVTVVFDDSANQVSYYVNGVYDTTASYTEEYAGTQTGNLYFGRDPITDNLPYGGLLDDVKIWNKALSSAEIAWEYNQGAPIYHWDFDEDQGILAGNAQGKAVTTDGLVGFWTMDSTTVNDLSGNANNLTNSGSPTSVAGIKGNAVDYLASSSQYSYCTDANCGADLDYQGNGIAVSAWVKADSAIGASNRFIVDKSYYTSSTDNGGYFLLESPTYGLGFCVRNSVGTDTTKCAYKSATALSTTYWQHLVGTYDGANVRFYLDGVLEATTACTTGIMNVGNYFGIGAGYSGTVNYFDGKIDHVKVWQRALSATEIKVEYGLDEKYGYLTNMDAATDWVEGAWPNPNRPKLGKALDFDGSNDYVSAAVNSTYATSLSISAWIYVPASWTNSYPDIVGIGDPSTHTDNFIDLLAAHSGISSYPHFQVKASGTSYAATGTSVLTPGWHHLLGILDLANQKIKLYVDSKLTEEDTGPASISISQTTKIGTTSNDDSTFRFNGQIDEVKIYNYALTADQVKLDYNNRAAVRF